MSVQGPIIATRRGIILLGVLGLVAFAAFAAFAIHKIAGTRIIRKGQYGPFQIGEQKQSALSKLVAMGIRNVEPLPYGFRPVELDNPSEQQIQGLDPRDGIEVRIAGDFSPLRVECLDGKISKTWPQMQVTGFEPAAVQQNKKAYAELQSQLVAGMPRSEAVHLIHEFGSTHSMWIGNFVVGWQEEWLKANRDIRTNPAYQAMVLRSDTWKFEGLRSEVWYSPYYSRVTLAFKDGRLDRIEHQIFPFELP